MTDLCIHLGLPKTGTTTLRRELLPQLDTYLTRSQEGKGQHRDKRKVKDLFHLLDGQGAPPDGRDRALQEWARRVYAWAQQRSASRVVISEERLSTIARGFPSGSKGCRAHPAEVMAEGLEAVRQAWEPFGSLRVLVTFRRQPEWIASMYAHNSNRMIRAGKADFEQRVERQLQAEPSPLDWSYWMQRLVEVVGAEHLFVGFLEEIERYGWMRELRDFLALSGEGLDFSGLTNQNRKTLVAGREWRLRPLDIEKWAASGLRQPGRSRKSRIALKAIQHGSLVAGPCARLGVAYRRDPILSLSPELEGRIMRHVEASNQRLAEDTGRDLRALGYMASEVASEPVSCGEASS